ncbi:hypothetical protein D7X33_29355, partial [Butyricicoccus sp. 1XD8-22]
MSLNTKPGEEVLTEKEKRKIEDCYILGKLAEDSYSLPTLGRDLGRSVSLTDFSGPDKVVFYIKSLSTEPLLLGERLGKTSSDVYVTFDNRNRRYLQRFEYMDLSDVEKVDFIRNHFEGKLILFKPKITYERNRDKYHYNLEIVMVEPDEDMGVLSYIPIPSIKQGITHNRFEKFLLDEKPLELTMYNHELDIPQFIVCDKYLYQIGDDALEKYQARETLYICRKPEEIRRIPLPENWSFEYARALYNDIQFISTNHKMELLNEFDEKGELIVDSYKQSEKIEVKKISENNDDFSSTPESFDNHNAIISESKFIEWIEFLAQKRGLIYEFNDIINFHTSLKTANFSILGGMSGTGKSELARLYADALGLKEGDNLLFVPVSPSYTEPSDVLGFLNPQTGIFLESEVGLVNFILEAERNPKKMHMVVFDEMNLGQVEHYFSPFISLLEGKKEERKLKLFGPKNITHQPELREISIGSNLLFVGTANFDETTRDFSNRMLDRSNVILLEKKNFIDSKREEEEASKDIDEYQSKTKNELHEIGGISAENFLSWIKEPLGLRALDDSELLILDKIHEEISNFDSQTGVSFRIVKSIGHYLDNIPKDEDGNDLLSREMAFDYQIKQRILTKVRGHREQIESLVGWIDEEENYKNG